MGGGAFTEKAFINALFFDCSKSRKLEPIVKDKATGRYPHDVFIRILFVRLKDQEDNYITSRRGLCMLLVRQ